MATPAHPLLHRILSTTNTPWNDWTSCLVYHHKAVNEMADWMERMHRFEVIMLTHIYPQVAEIARSDTEFEQMINKMELSVRDMAIADKHDRIRCEKIIIAWDKLSGFVRETLSKQPTREQINAAIDYRVFASRTFLATVRLRPAYDPSRNKPPQVFIAPGAFDHDYTTSVRLRTNLTFPLSKP